MRDDDGPEVSVVEGPAGRDTLALIADLAGPMRAEQPTLDYGDRISNAPGAQTPGEPNTSSATDAAAQSALPLAIFEMLTFVVQGAEVASLASEAVRRGFVEQHLLRRLPTQDMAQVDRVDVTPWIVQGMVVVRVWVKL